MLVTLSQISELSFHLTGTNSFYVKEESERFSTVGSPCRQNINFDNFTSSFGRLRQEIAPKSVPHEQNDYFSSFKQSCLLLMTLSLPLLLSFLKLSFEKLRRQLQRKRQITIELFVRLSVLRLFEV